MAPDSTGGPVDQSPACAEFLACIAELEPPMLPSNPERFEAGGSCWVDATAAQECTASCEAETERLCPPMGSGGGTGDDPLLCSIEALAPTAISPVEVGEGAEQLPPEIGDLLERNCGCHYVDPARLDPEVPAYFGAITMATWQDFHSPFMGQQTYLRVQQRSVVELSMPPPFFCDSLEFGSLGADDFALLGAWLDAGAPDAATWTGG